MKLTIIFLFEQMNENLQFECIFFEEINEHLVNRYFSFKTQDIYTNMKTFTLKERNKNIDCTKICYDFKKKCTQKLLQLV